MRYLWRCKFFPERQTILICVFIVPSNLRKKRDGDGQCCSHRTEEETGFFDVCFPVHRRIIQNSLKTCASAHSWWGQVQNWPCGLSCETIYSVLFVSGSTWIAQSTGRPEPIFAWRILSHVSEEACVPISCSDLPLRCAFITLTAKLPAPGKPRYLENLQSNQQCLKGFYFFKAKFRVTENFAKQCLKQHLVSWICKKDFLQKSFIGLP